MGRATRPDSFGGPIDLSSGAAPPAPLVRLLRRWSDLHPLYDLAEIGVRHARNRCTTSAEITVRMRPLLRVRRPPKPLFVFTRFA
jgi:hypothetical protein